MWVCVVFFCVLLLLLLFLYLFCLSLNIYQCAMCVNVTLVFHFSQSILQFNSSSFSRTLMSVCIVYPLQIHSFTISTCYLVFYFYSCFLAIFNSLCDEFRFFLFKCHPNWHCVFLSLLFLLPFYNCCCRRCCYVLFLCLFFLFSNDFGLLLMMFAYF